MLNVRKRAEPPGSERSSPKRLKSLTSEGFNRSPKDPAQLHDLNSTPSTLHSNKSVSRKQHVPGDSLNNKANIISPINKSIVPNACQSRSSSTPQKTTATLPPPSKLSIAAASSRRASYQSNRKSIGDIASVKPNLESLHSLSSPAFSRNDDEISQSGSTSSGSMTSQTCAACKKTSSPLFNKIDPCTRCKRLFHTGCINPKSTSDQRPDVCYRCKAGKRHPSSNRSSLGPGIQRRSASSSEQGSTLEEIVVKCPPNKSQSPSEVAIKTPYTDSSSDKDTTENNAKLGASEMRNESDLPNQPRDSNPPIKLERVSPNQANNRSEYRPKYDRESTTSRLEGTRLSTRKASTDRTVENSLSKSPKSYPNTLHESPSKSNRFHNSSEDEMAEADWKTGDKWERTVLTQNHVTINKDIKSSGGMSYVEQSMTFEGSRTRNGEGIAYVSRTELDGSVEQPASNLQICSPSKLDKLPSLLSRSPTPVTFTSPSFENGDGRQVGHQSLLGQFEALKCKVTGKFDEKRLAQFLNVIEKARSTQPFNTMFPGYGELDASKLEENQACTEVWLEAMFDVHLPESDKFDASKPEEIRALKLAATAFQSYMIGRQNAVISPQPLDQSVRLSPTVQQREYDQLRKSPDVEKRSPRTKSTRSEVTSTKNETASSSLHECQPTSGLPADNNPVDISGLNSLFYQKIYAQRGYTLRSTLALALLAIGKGKISAEMAADWMKENLPTVHQRYEDGASLKRSLNTTLYNKKEKWFDKLPGDSKAKNEFRFEVGVQQKFLDDYVLPYITLHKGQAINGSKMAQTVLNKASSSSHISFVSGNTSRNSSASKSATTLNTSSSIETETLQTSGISTNRLLNGNHSSEDDSFLGNDGLAIVTSTPALNRQVRMAGTFNDMTSAKSIVSNRIPRRENLTGLSDGKARILQDKEVNLSNEDAGDVEMRNVSNEEPARAIGSQMEPVSGAEPDVMDVDEEGDNSEDSTDDFKSIIQIYSPTMKLRQQFPTEIFKEGSNLSLEGQIPKPTLKLTSSARRISRKDGFQKLLSTARSYRSNIHQETTWRQRSRESPEIAGNSSIVQERADPDKSIQDLSVFVPSRYQNIWEALDIPKQAIPMLHDNKLAFRSGQKINGRLPRPKVVYKLGNFL